MLVLGRTFVVAVPWGLAVRSLVARRRNRAVETDRRRVAPASRSTESTVAQSPVDFATPSPLSAARPPSSASDGPTSPVRLKHLYTGTLRRGIYPINLRDAVTLGGAYDGGQLMRCLQGSFVAVGGRLTAAAA